MGIMVMAPSRTQLEVKAGQTVRVVCEYARKGIRKAGSHTYPTILVCDVRDAETGSLLTDHLWFNQGNIWLNAGLVPGDVITFMARAIEYRTGCWGPDHLRRLLDPPRRDYRLTPPVGLQLIWRVSTARAERA